MSVYGAFSSSVLGMRAQAEALSNIGINIANVNTGGFRRVDTQFQTVLGQNMFEQSDIGGVSNKTYNRFDVQGNIVSTNSAMDIAISGKSFFTVTDALSGGEEFYTRDGAFQMVVTGTESVTEDGNTYDAAIGYLADKNGYFVLGWAADENGVVSTSGTPEVMRIDRNAFLQDPAQTTEATLRMNLPSTADVGDKHKYIAALYDTDGDEQALQMEWTKTASNTWDLVTTHESTPIPQISTVTMAGTVEAGDTYSVSVGGTTVTYTVTGAEANIDAVRDGLVAAVNAHATVSAVVTAAAGASGKLTLTGVTAGDSFTAGASASNGATAVKQIDTVTLSGTVETGDTYSVTVDGNVVTYTVLAGDTTIADVRTGLVNAIAADGTVSALVTAAAGTAAGELTLTAATAGTGFTATVATPITGVTVDNAATVATTTANQTSTADNTAAIATTQTAGNTQVVSSATEFTFDGSGIIETPTSFDFSGTWSNSATTAVTFDFSGLTQYASGDLFVYTYDANGHEAGAMSGIEFDANGKIIGKFSNGRTLTLYQLALTDFANPNALEQKSGNVFAETTASGVGTHVAAGTQGISIRTYSHELSNVDIAEEFSKIIMTQNAYNSSATVFKTVDEMTTVARDLKG